MRRSIGSLSAAVLLALAPAADGLAQTAGAGPYGPSWPTFWWLMPLAFLLVMASLCFSMMRRGGRSEDGRDGSTKAAAPALRILDMRYAKGEIERQEYEERKAVITGSACRQG